MDFFGTDWGELAPFVAVGFAAQLIDGALGMAFGAIAATLLTGWMGMSPAQASYQIHLIKSFTTAASGASHVVGGNIDKRLFLHIVLPGVLGGAAGAYGLAQINGEAIKPFVFAYLGILGMLLIRKAMRGETKPRAPKAVVPLGFFGGLLDAVGGSGWGPVVGSGLMLQGTEPRKVVGSVNAAEFFVAIAISAVFIGHFGLAKFTAATLGLLIGGIFAAPFGALAARHLPAQVMLGAVGTALTGITGYWFVTSYF